MFPRLCLVLFVLLSLLPAQQISGRLEGIVADSQGARIPNVTVVATHVETNTVYRASTNESGVFVLPNVRLGVYSVVAELTGFRKSVINDVKVEVGGTTALNVNMEVGALQEAVTVTAEGAQAIVNTVDAELGGVVDQKQVLELPLNGRNAVELAMQQAGVFFERSPDGQGDKLIVHGQRHRSVNMLLDGIDTQDNLNRASSTMVDQPLLPMAAENVQEFRVVTGLASAEYSRGGVQISGVTRSGSNRFRGSLFWFNRNDFFSANEFFNNSARPAVDTPQLNRNQFGGRIGGPIRKDKTFFYVGYQQTREVRGTPVNRSVYTAEARRGIYRYLNGIRTTPESVAANPGLIRTVNLLACGGQEAAILGRPCVDSRFDAQNPATLDPFMRDTVFGVMPLPNNFDLGDGLNTGGFRFNSKSATQEHLPSIRLDHRITDKHLFYGTFNYVDRDINGDYINDREPQFPALDALGARVTHSRGFSASLSSNFTPRLINEARFGFLGGENAFNVNQPFGTPFTLDINTISNPYDPASNTNARDNRTVHLRDVITYVRGNHTIKAGAEWRQRYIRNYSFFDVNPYGRISLDDDDNPPGFNTTDITRVSGGTSINSNDIELARDLQNNLVGAMGEVFLRYNVSSIDSGFVPGFPEIREYQNQEFDWFINDTWRLKPNLVLSLGVRWEWAQVPYEKNGIALAPPNGLLDSYGISGPEGFFNPGVFKGMPCASLGQLPLPVTSVNVASFITDCATKYVPATSSNNFPLWNNDLNNFAPVVSIAWDPFKDGRTSIRAGFRISYMQDSYSVVDDTLGNNEGLQVLQSCFTPSGQCLNNPTLLRQLGTSGAPIPAAPPFRIPSTRSILDSSTIDFRGFDKNLGTPYYNEWTFGISREITKNWAVEARYVGNRGVGLRRVADYNEFNLTARDGVSGQTFLDSFVKAQANLNCNRNAGLGSRFDDASGAPCIVPNPLMAALIAGDAASLRTRAGLITPLDQNATGQFLHRLTQVETSRPAANQPVVRGGSFWGQVLSGRLPANFFQVNPFVASARTMINDGFSTYHGLELEVRRRFARGFSLQGNYTYGKALADYDGDANAYLNDTRPSPVRFPRYNKQEIMPRHQINANWLYELPFGRNGLAFQKGLGRAIFGGWQLSGLLSWRSGRPLTPVSGIGTFLRGDISDDNTVDLTSNVSSGQIRSLTGVRNIGDGVFYFDPCLSAFAGGNCTDPDAVKGLFALPQPGQLGALGQTTLFGPQRFLIDASLMKRFRLDEGKDFEFRWEVFNVLNRANFADPVMSITSSNFGQITRTVNTPRLMQFALKLNF